MTRLKAMRNKRGLTQKQLAEKAGVSFRVLQNYEQGVKQIDHARLETLLKLCIALDCRIADICESEDIRALMRKYDD